MTNLLQVDGVGNVNIFNIDPLQAKVTHLNETIQKNHTSINQIHSAFEANVNKKLNDVYMKAVNAQSSADSNTSNAQRCKQLTTEISDHYYAVMKDTNTFLNMHMHNKTTFDHHFSSISTKCNQLQQIPGCPRPFQCKAPSFKLN